MKITEVTDLIIHNEDFTPPSSHQKYLQSEKVAPVNKETVKETPEADIKETDTIKPETDIKKEVMEKPMPILISANDAADVTWKCKECKETFGTEDLARQHVLLKHLMHMFDKVAPKDRKIFTCDQCFKYSTVSRISFIKHMGMIHHFVPETEFQDSIEQCRTLLLDIDVIKCKCKKQFDKQRQLKDHIIFTHFKSRFKHIPKGLSSYKCKDYSSGCGYSSNSRVILIKHMISEHKALTEQDFSSYMNDSEEIIPVEDDSSIESLDNDGSSIGFNDSVSQVLIIRIIRINMFSHMQKCILLLRSLSNLSKP